MVDPVPAGTAAHVQAHLAAVVDSSDDVIISTTLDGVIMSWNRAAERVLGWTASEAVGHHISLIIPPDRLSEEEDVLARIRRGERIDHFETVRAARDGRPVHVSLTVSPIRDGAGHIVGASKVARDITEQRQSHLVQARLAAIVDSSDDVIVSKTLQGVITSWNRAAERVFGWTEQEAVGRNITLIIPEERHAEEEAVLARIARGERVDHFETVRVTKDGRPVEVSITVSPIKDQHGRVVGASKIARDISQQRQAEHAREQALEQARQAQQEAESLSRTKDHLLATVSHELRTPLNAVFGWARMLQSSALDAAGRTRALDAIVRSASAQSRLVEDLLDLSRAITGRMRLEFDRVDLNAVIETALEAIRPTADTKGLTMVTTLDSSVGVVTGAADRLQQVVWNLVMNAVKFTPAGGRVSIASRRVGDRVQLAVTDNGEGIDPHVLPYVFDAFRQEDSSTTRGHGGLGLGLALVRQLVEAHGGQVRAESPGKGQGSTFTVILPSIVDSDAAGRAVGASARESISSLRGIRVLVIDDDMDSLDLSATMLRSAGGEVRTASSAFLAHEIVTTWEPHVILTDLAMPSEDGFMVLAAMRATFLKRGARVPIIAITAHGSSESRHRALQAGFDLYLTKPVDPSNLTSAVVEAARRAS